MIRHFTCLNRWTGIGNRSPWFICQSESQKWRIDLGSHLLDHWHRYWYQCGREDWDINHHVIHTSYDIVSVHSDSIPILWIHQSGYTYSCLYILLRKIRYGHQVGLHINFFIRFTPTCKFTRIVILKIAFLPIISTLTTFYSDTFR